MPFKLKLKKSRHYSVASKSLFVISVELLDGTNVECTLSSESTGQDCLDTVCQKLGLNQPKFFGLQYMNSNGENSLYWLELDKPVKRQLDKYSVGLCVYLRIMYYIISGVRLLTDEVTRYHYFLQLKMDVIEGRISCTLQQSIELASYCMQAEFGNFDAERHTAGYLKEFQLFPKSFTDPALLESLTEYASQQHASLNNLPQGTAEEYYICACQSLEGYGQEIFAVKDRLGDDAIISVSLTEISIGYASGKEGRHYGWVDIKNVINHKRDFTIETVALERVEFQFVDVESAKNAWRFCVAQHTFYRQYEMGNEETNSNVTAEVMLPRHFQQAQIEEKLHTMGSCENMSKLPLRSVSTQSLNNRVQSTSCLHLNKSGSTNMDVLRSMLPSYRPAPDYETAVQHKINTTTVDIVPSAEPMRHARTILYSSQPDIHHTDSFSTHPRFSNVMHNIEQKGILRTAYNSGFTQSQIILSKTQDKFPENVKLLQLYKQPPPYSMTNKISFNSTPDLAGGLQAEATNHFVNSFVSGSTPDLVSDVNLYPKHHHQPMVYNQPVQPVYPVEHPVHRSHSYLLPHHGTYENLSSIFNNNMLGQPQTVILDNSNVPKHIKKVYDEHGNIIYCMAAAPPPNIKPDIQNVENSNFVLARNRTATVPNDNNPQEPIYENIPLPWAEQTSEIRARTQSTHSAPEISRVVSDSAVASMLQKASIQPILPKEAVYANVDSSTGELVKKSNFKVQHRSPESTKTSSNVPSYNSSPSVSFANTSYSHSNDTSTSTSQSYDVSSSSNASSNKSKKKRWGILIGRHKSSEKMYVKSATLGREQENKKNKQGGANRNWWFTGLPRFHPLPPSISKETMCQLLENKLADSQLFFEFDEIPKKKPNGVFTKASHRDNAAFNRFKDVLPYEDNRLRLTPTKNNKSGYINASHITATVGSKQRFYIAAQGPTRVTILYFWQCIWEAEVYLIVQLTDSTEDFMYIPNANERCIDVQDYQVWWEFSQNSGSCITSKIRLCHVPYRRYRTLWHLHYTNWGDQGCPCSVSHFLGFLEEMQSVHQHSMEEIPPGHNKNPPVLVHCTAGVGRTGLTILSDLLLYTVDHNQEVCIPRVLELLRYQRAYMIQTIAQYRFVYSLLIYYLKQTRLI